MFSFIIDALNSFIFLIGTIQSKSFLKPLKKEEEEKYIKEMEKGNKEAREKLIEHNLRLVAHIVKKYDLHNEKNDLISIGSIGLIKAIDTYKREKGKKLTSYASRCIENEILMYLRSNKHAYNTISLDEPFSKEDNNISLLDSISAQEENIIEKMELEQSKIKLLKCMYILDDKEKDIIEKRYGLNNQKEMKQKEIAKLMNISRSYVSRIEKRALLKLFREYTKK